MKNMFFATLIGSVLISSQIQAQDNGTFKTKSVSIFKNDSAFFIKDGKVKTKDGKYLMTEDLPRALFGTFWIHSPINELKQVGSYQDLVTTKKEMPVSQFIDMLEANKGKKMKIYIGTGEYREIYEGTPEEIITKNEKGEEIHFVNQTITVFKTTKGEWLSFSPNEISRIQFLEKPNQVVEKEITEIKYVLDIGFATQKAEQPLEMMYLQNGINWTPTYLLELESDTKATLSLRAEVKNDAEDIENTDVNFVVGVPNFKYANKLSTLVDFLGMVHGRYNDIPAQSFTNAIQQYSSEDDEVMVTPIGAGVTGDAEEDLYFYNVKNITLKKNGRGQYPVFKEKINVEHIYEANIGANPVTQNSYQKKFLYTPNNQNPVFHSIRIENQLQYPLTTGSAMVVSTKSGKTRPISQDMLKYTPVKGHSYIKLTESPDIKISHAEREINRETKVTKVNDSDNYYYDLVTVEGKVKVKNYKSKTVDLNLKRTINGELKKSDVKWSKDEKINHTGSPNKITNVTWETKLGAGKELEITYTYEVYIPRYYK